MNKLPIIVLFTILIISVIIGVLLMQNRSNLSNTYQNVRFNYVISYPSTWKDGSESENHDGRSLYKDKDGNEVLVWGTHMPRDYSKSEDLVEKSELNSSSGENTTKYLVKSSSNKSEIYYAIKVEEGQAVLMVKGSDSFLSENSKIIDQVVQSFRAEK